MAFTVERFDDEPIVVVTVRNPIGDIIGETIASDNAVAEATADVTDRYFRITDITDLHLSISEIVAWLAEQKQASPGSINDPRAISLTVGAEGTNREAADWARQEQYGGKEILLFETVDEALAYAREQVLSA